MPTDIFKGFTDAIGGFIGSPIVQLGIQAIALYIAIIWVAVAFWAFRDMQLRTSNPVLPYLAATLIIAFTPLFFIFAVPVYKIVRPQERMGEAFERGLAEEALMAEIEAIEHCATCRRKVHEEWILCPTCRTRLKRVCPNCNKLVGLEWSLCAWCGRDFERREAVGAIGAVPRPVREPESALWPVAPAPAPLPVAANAAAGGAPPVRTSRARSSTASRPSQTT